MAGEQDNRSGEEVGRTERRDGESGKDKKEQCLMICMSKMQSNLLSCELNKKHLKCGTKN